MGKAEQDFTKLTEEDENGDDASKQLKEASKSIDDIKSSIDSVKDQISDMIINNSDSIDKYGKLGFKIIFSVLVIVDAGIAATMLLLCLCSGKTCSTCCCFKCAFKILLHVLWNILAFLMFLTFLIGFLFTLIGTIGKDFVQIVSFIISEENLGKENIDEIILLDDAAKKLEICINKDGEIINELGINLENMDQLNDLQETETKISELEVTMNELKNQRVAYKNYSEILDKRAHYSSLDFGLKKIGETNLLNLKDKLNELNSKTKVQVNERWGFECSTSCSEISGPSCTYSETETCFNLKNSDCISSPPDNSKIEERYSTCSNLETISQSNGPIINIIIHIQNYENTNAIIKQAIDSINTAYTEFLNKQTESLGTFKTTIQKLTGIFSGLQVKMIHYLPF